MNFQENFFDTYQQLEENLQISIGCLPLCFYYDYEKIKYYEHSKRALLPKYILHQLSAYENIKFPIHIKITNKDISKYVTVLEFLPDIDHLYISNNMFDTLQLTENDIITFEILKDPLPTATSIKIKPHSNNFALIEDKKSYLEANFKNLFGIIEKGDIVSTPYLDKKISIDILDCQPSDIVSMIEIEELEVDIETSHEYDHAKKLEEQREKELFENAQRRERERLEQLKNNQNNENNHSKKEFKPFSGKGRTLGSS